MLLPTSPLSHPYPPPNDSRKIRAKGSHIPTTLANISRFARIVNPTKKKSTKEKIGHCLLEIF
jgi:hypothetical protein